MPKDIRQGAGTHWVVTGTGDRPALAIHCMLGSAEIWTPVFSRLGDRVTATAIDLPGHGRSDPWQADPAPGSYQTLATRITASFIDRPVDLIGHSFGAIVALRIAVAAPEAVRSLTLVEPPFFAAIAGSAECDLWLEKQDRLDALFAAGRYDDAARDFMADWGAGVPWDALPERQRDRFIQQIPMLAGVGPSNFHDPAEILRPGGIEAIDAPCLMVHGANSPAATVAINEAIAARMADVGLASVPEAGHMLPLTHPAQMADLIAVNLERS